MMSDWFHKLRCATNDESINENTAQMVDDVLRDRLRHFVRLRRAH